MPLAKCIRRCWDSQLTRRYWPGDQDNMDPNHPLVKGNCFEFVEVPKTKDEPPVETEVRRGPGRPKVSE